MMLGSVHGGILTSTVPEDNGATDDSNGNQVIYSTPDHPAIVNQAAGYDFSAQYTTITSISAIDFTMTMIDGDSANAGGDFDYTHLLLYVGAPSDYNATTRLLTGGVDTGIVLNGFRTGQTDTIEFTLAIDPATTGASIISELNTGAGFLDAFVVSNNAADQPTANGGNQVFLGNDASPSNATTTLAFTVPEPSSYAFLGLGLIGILIATRFRFGRGPA